MAMIVTRASKAPDCLVAMLASALLAGCLPLPPIPIFMDELTVAGGSSSCEVTVVRDQTSEGFFKTQYVFLDPTAPMKAEKVVAALDANAYTTFRVTQGTYWVGVYYRVGQL